MSLEFCIKEQRGDYKPNLTFLKTQGLEGSFTKAKISIKQPIQSRNLKKSKNEFVPNGRILRLG